jgi:aspartyl-tRNA(Asn)/glutamyl-tRNA(Gln) amidotransferase subunit A
LFLDRRSNPGAETFDGRSGTTAGDDPLLLGMTPDTGPQDDHNVPGVSRRGLLAGTAGAGLAAWLHPASASAATRRHRRHHRRQRATTKSPAPGAPPASGLPDPGPIAAQHANPADLGVLEAAALLQAGLLTSAELTAACQARIAARNGGAPTFDGAPDAVNAWVRLYPEVAGRLAAAADARLAAARRSPDRAPLLTGVPVALKDLYAVQGLELTASSRILAGNVAPGDSAVWRRLAANGMVLLGHTHTDEFAFLAVTPQCGNPWQLARAAGGSSGGSAAALAARMVTAATGSDTLGSLRIPAAFCGVSSIKPTFGLVSAAGVIPLAWSLDHCGPLARSVADCSLLLSAMAGRDPDDPATDVGHTPPATYPLAARSGARPLQGVRIGIPRAVGGMDAGPGQVYARTQQELASLGAQLVAVDEPPNPFTAATDPLAFYTDAADYHQPWFPSRAAEYRPPAAQMLSLIRGLGLSALQYLDLHRRRAAYQAAYRRFLADERLDAVAVPVTLADPPQRTPSVNPLILSPATNPENGKLLTYAYSYLGFPVVTVPGGASAAGGLPVGIQLVGGPFTEAGLIQIGIDLQEHYPHFTEQPAGLASSA